MSHKENWQEKKFNFDFPASNYVEFLRFLRETPVKIETLVENLPRKVLVQRPQNSWSIQENVGHLLITESLFLSRLDDYEKDAPALQAARYDDNPTDKANFNEREIHLILDEFREQRGIYLHRLTALNLNDFNKAILHPRLNKPMRLCDTLFFQVEHDQHHMTRITELKELWHVNLLTSQLNTR